MSHFFLSNILKSAVGKACVHCEAEMIHLKNVQESRRKFLKDAAIAAGGMLLLPSILNATNFNKDKKIVIIGAGMAGLNAAYQLQKLGLNAQVYEAAKRTGGRMYTLKNAFGAAITTDIGGEFVDTSHHDILALAKEFKLDFYDLSKETLTNKTIYFNNTFYSEKDLAEALQPFVKKILLDIISLPQIKNYTTAEAIKIFDNQSVATYIKSLGIEGWLYNFLYTVFTSEFGVEASEQSAINFLIMFVAAVNEENNYQLFGHDHETMKIKGGSQKLADALAANLKNTIHLEHELVGINSDGEETVLNFKNKGKEVVVNADYVVMTLAFTKLKTIEFNVPMAPQKRKCIDELGYGNSCKFIMGFKDKPWRKQGKQGYTFTDESFGTGWDSSQRQSNANGSFTVFGGGNNSGYINQNTEQRLSNTYLTSVNKIYEGARELYTGKNLKFCWQNSPISKAGYSCYKVGQYSTIGGWESAAIENIYFAGEHTSVEFQGYMNGAAETGRKAAAQIAAKVLITKNTKQ